MRLTKEREAEIRDQIALMRARLSYQHQRWTRADACTRLPLTASEELLAELDAVRAELDEWKTHLIAEDERLLLTESVVVMERQLTRACAERDAARADAAAARTREATIVGAVSRLKAADHEEWQQLQHVLSHLADATREHDASIRADERAKVVAWLRGRATKLSSSHLDYAQAYAGATDAAADAIERGEHEVKP